VVGAKAASGMRAVQGPGYSVQIPVSWKKRTSKNPFVVASLKTTPQWVSSDGLYLTIYDDKLAKDFKSEAASYFAGAKVEHAPTTIQDFTTAAGPAKMVTVAFPAKKRTQLLFFIKNGAKTEYAEFDAPTATYTKNFSLYKNVIKTIQLG
ncbi:MAG TPA: hypothetical protein VHB97_03435, partial [Polyangia bacterium]|nr:hypothetical protein [Polyangia bacterium]